MKMKDGDTAEAPQMNHMMEDEMKLETIPQFVTKPLIVSYKDLYEESKNQLARKDELIQDLSYRLGNLESELRNSIPMLEYKKATFLLESSQSKQEDEKKELS
jgi:hypothetical protein